MTGKQAKTYRWYFGGEHFFVRENTEHEHAELNSFIKEGMAGLAQSTGFEPMIGDEYQCKSCGKWHKVGTNCRVMEGEMIAAKEKETFLSWMFKNKYPECVICNRKHNPSRRCIKGKWKIF